MPQVNIAPYPERLDFAQAAAAILTFLTAWQMVVHKARVQPGETVLVHGAGLGHRRRGDPDREAATARA